MEFASRLELLQGIRPSRPILGSISRLNSFAAGFRRMKIVAIATSGNFNAHVLDAVHRHWPLQCVIRPVWQGQPVTISKWERLRRAPFATIRAAIEHRWDGYRARRLDRQVGRRLFGAAEAPPIDVEQIAIPNWQMNSPATADLLRHLAPDILLLSGAPILKRRLFEIPRIACLNLHRGISPDYRGEWTLFWPLYFRDYAKIGVTLHEVDSGIDTGAIWGQARPQLSPHDTEATITAYAARLAAQLIVDVLDSGALAERRANEKGSGTPCGRLFLNRHRTLGIDAWFNMRRMLLAERPAPLGPWFQYRREVCEFLSNRLDVAAVR
jgi:folate-dependent phosphoribosylglycinamide formyltransferase PurN